uniref:Putative iodide/myo-inositol/multivitamin symporter n=1 Tax=Ixodes ricinus TaxID=34613 RepID=A0A6B0V0X4_IXORI
MGSATKVIISIYSAVTGPFCGLLLLAFLFPCANSKGASTATLMTVSFQMWHMSQKIIQGSLPPRLPVTVDYCPGNFTGTSRHLNETLLTQDHTSTGGFFLSQMSTYWSNLISAILTIAIGLAISLLTGGRQTYKQHIHLSSDTFLALWRKLGFISSEHDTTINLTTVNTYLGETTYEFQNQDNSIIKNETKI